MRPVIYQIFVRHFSNYSTSMKEWGSKEENGCGTFNGITDLALQKIKELGITHVWLTGILRHATCTSYPGVTANPPAVVKGIAGSPYAITDYYDVDPDLAINTENRLSEFTALLDRCHKAGLVPLIDFIPNHISRDYCCTIEGMKSFGDGDRTDCFFYKDNSFFYLSPDSPGNGPPLKLPEEGFYKENIIGRVTGNNCITWTPGVNDWYETVKLNYGFDFTKEIHEASMLPQEDASIENVPDTWRHMDNIIAYWQDKGVGGFRSDMAHMVPVPFWRWVIRRAHERNPQVLFIAEAYDDHMKTTSGSPLPELIDAGYDYVYDAPSYHLSHKIYEEGKWANDFDSLCNNDSLLFLRPVRYLENHDEPRMGSPLHWGGVGSTIAPAISTLIYALSPGAILFYNGQEVGEQASGPGGFGGDNGRTSIFDYTHLPSLSKWTNKGQFDGALLSEDELSLRKHYSRILPLLQNPALAHGQLYGLNWFNKNNPEFGRLSEEEVSGHWLYAYLRHDFESGKTILCVANLNPEWSFPHIRVIIPKGAFEWMKWQHNHVYFKELGSTSPLTDPYLLEELDDSGFKLSLKIGEGKLFEVSY